MSNMNKRPYPSPYADIIVSYVREHPGCCKWDVARHVARACHPSKLYYLVNTAIRYGAITAHRTASGKYQLFVEDSQNDK